MYKKYFFIILILLGNASFAAEEPDHEIHQALRGLLSGIETAINEERYNDLAPYFHEKLRVTTINQEVISSREGIGAYFNRWFGPGGFLKKVDIKLTPDALTELYDDKKFGIVRGKGLEKYVLADGRSYDMLTRWTATVIHDDDGQWRILALHIGTDFLDNPILTEAEASLLYFAVGGFILGIILTGLLVVLVRRRKH